MTSGNLFSFHPLHERISPFKLDDIRKTIKNIYINIIPNSLILLHLDVQHTTSKVTRRQQTAGRYEYMKATSPHEQFRGVPGVPY